MIPFVGPSYKLQLLNADCQRVVNMYPVANEVGGGATGVYLESIPGLDVFSAIPAESAVGWYNPADGDDETTISPSNFGHFDFTSSFNQIRPHCGIVPGAWPITDDSVTECFIESWTPVTPGAPAPSLLGTVGGYFESQEVQPALDGSFHVVQGVAVFRFRVDGVTVPGRCVMTTYVNDDTGGYGGISWETLA